MTFEKLSESNWYPVFGNVSWTSGQHVWKIKVDEYPTSDWSGFTIGVCQTHRKESLIKNGHECCGSN